MGDALTRAYRKGQLEAEGFPLEDVSEHLERDDTVVWVDFCGPSAEQLHELAIEDALGPTQRPKVDPYETFDFLSTRAVRFDADSGQLHESEIDAFINPRWLITVRKDEGFPIEPVLTRWDRSGKLASFGVAYLLYALLDTVVDGYFEAVDGFDRYYEEIGDQIFAERPLDPKDQRQWFDVRQAMVRFHRLVVPMREAVMSLMRRERGLVEGELYPYYQDVYDHILRVSEQSDSLRDLVSTIVETNLSLRDYRQNQIVKKVSSWAAIAAVPALVTGYYGMNVPFPGSGRPLGVILATALIVVSSLGLYVLFRSRDWL